jgi:hypothetical protein
MQNSENNKKKKIPLFPKFKTSSTFKKNRETAMLSDSSDDSNILEDSSDYETNEEQFNIKNTNTNNNIQTRTIKDLRLKAIKSLSIDIQKTNINTCLTPRNTIDNFKDIEDYIVNSAFDKKNYKNKIEEKNKKKEGKTPEKNNKEKNSNKIINDFYINNEGDIELSEKNVKDGKNKQKIEQNNNVTKFLGPLMEEDENYRSIFINQNKSIFNSKKELWKFQKILLDNQIFDIKSKKLLIIIFYILFLNYSVKRNMSVTHKKR